jgi:hypothetical protein
MTKICSVRFEGGTQGNGVPQLVFRNVSVPLLLLFYNYNARQVLRILFF